MPESPENVTPSTTGLYINPNKPEVAGSSRDGFGTMTAAWRDVDAPSNRPTAPTALIMDFMLIPLIAFWFA
jgi:hypothetical protein